MTIGYTMCELGVKMNGLDAERLCVRPHAERGDEVEVGVVWPIARTMSLM